jgi:hypothetical protein
MGITDGRHGSTGEYVGLHFSAENINILVLWGGKWKILVTE